MSARETGVVLGPAPGGRALTFDIECRTSRTSSAGGTHRVAVRPDWTVETPHDLAAERIAAAFGGYTSCLELADVTVPMLSTALGLITRREPAPLRRDRRGEWRVVPAAQARDCCRALAFPTAAAAAAHARSDAHLARRHGAPEWQVAAVSAAAGRAWRADDREPPPHVGAEALVSERDGLFQLWRAGIHPASLPALAEPAAVVRGPLPVSYFLGALYGHSDPTWLASVLRHRPDAETATWLAWADQSGRSPDPLEWGAWLALGLPKRDVLTALDAGLSASSVHEIAGGLDRSLRATAAEVVAWAAAGCTPTTAHFRALVRWGVEHAHPSGPAIDALVADLDRTGSPPCDRTELGVLLAVLGTRSAVLVRVARGIRTVADLEGADESMNRPPPAPSAFPAGPPTSSDPPTARDRTPA